MASHDEPNVDVILTAEGVCHARVVGEIDFDVAPQVRARLQSLITEQCPTLVMDVSGVTFCDSSGLGVLVGLRSASLARGGCVRLTGPTGQLARLLQITGLDRLFCPADTAAGRPAAAAGS